MTARRVLQVVGSMERGGIQAILMQLARRLDRERYRLDFLLTNPHPEPYDDELRRLGCRLIPCPGHRNPWRYARGFAAAMRAHGPYDVVHGHLHYYNGVVMRLAARHGVPVRIAHSHNDHRALPEDRRPARRLYGDIMRRWIRRHATLKVAASGMAAEALFGPGWRQDPGVRVIHYGLDPAPFAAEPAPGPLRCALGLPPDALVIGHVGRFVGQKNHAFLLEVIAAAAAREPRVRALLVGDGPLRPRIEARARELGLAGRVVFAGDRTDVPDLMLGAMDGFAFPSLHEGLGIVLLEAQAAGLPCVFSDRVPEEAAVVPGLLHRLPLEAPPERWADALLAALGPPAGDRAVDRAEARAAIGANAIDLAQAFAGLYDGAPRARAGEGPE